MLVGALLWLDLAGTQQAVTDLARVAARSSSEKDLLVRRWAAGHGGVYVPITDQTPPNPYLTNMPERDLTTPTGRALTLMNPAYMTRQVYELSRAEGLASGHITSLKPIRPGNAPDAWERQALEAFERGTAEVSEVVNFEGQRQMRLMRPFMVEASCLLYHAAQGYKVGDIRGGISVAVPMKNYEGLVQPEQRQALLAYPLVWLLGLMFIGAWWWQIKKQQREHAQVAAQQRLSADILHALNRGGDLRSMVGDVLRTLQQATKCDAVGLRLRQGEDWPYYEQSGFAEAFLKEENFLCARRGDGAIIRDALGRVTLECTCGLVLAGRTDPAMPCFTADGSFWTNRSTDLLALAPEADPRTHPRNTCIHTGYQSVALIPLRSGTEIIGLLQLNARRAGAFTLALIHAYESLADKISLALKRVQVEAERARLFEELTEKNKELERVLYAASHDLRSPLLNTYGFCKRLDDVQAQLSQAVLLPGVGAEARQVLAPLAHDVMPKALGCIHASVEKMNSLINGMLRLSRLGHMVLYAEPLEMNLLLRKVVSSLTFQLQTAHGAVELGALPDCSGDAGLVNQIFTNLLDNAIKYRDPARPLRIQVSGQITGERVVFCVADNGLGLAPGEQEKIWDLFHRVNPAGPPGEGLGLKLVRRIVWRHQGRVWVESTLGEGSRFFVALPAA